MREPIRCRTSRLLRKFCILVLLSAVAKAAENHGQVTFNGLPVPGATITATQGAVHQVAISDQQGLYSFPDLPEGVWQIEVQMQLFAPQTRQITVTPESPAATWKLELLPSDQILAKATVQAAVPVEVAVAIPSGPQRADEARKATISPPADTIHAPEESASRASDGFLINGSTNNAATSQFTLAQAFGNNRGSSKSLYTGGFGLILGNSAFDARPYAITGLQSAKPFYNRVTGIFTLGRPINIARYHFHGPNFFVAYQWTRDNDASTQPGLVPTPAQRSGDLSAFSGVITDPASGLPFTGNQVPVSPQAQALLALYPLPNVAGNPRYNFQLATLNSSHQDSLQTRLDKSITRKNQLYGGFALQSTRASDTNLFGFKDTTDSLGLNSNINLNHRFSQRLFLNLGYRFSRMRVNIDPFFSSRANISGAAGITGNDQAAANWGPPTLQFSSGISTLTDGISAFNRDRTDAVSASFNSYRGHHNVTAGMDFRRQEFNEFGQQNPRGSFAFTAAATGYDFADFLLSLPDTSSLAFGNPDKYLRQSVYDGYATDDWRLRPDLTINAGLRWEYGAPITELFNRLVNLDVSGSFTAVAPVLASQPTGPLTGNHYPSSLLLPTRNRFEPRVGVSWRPVPGSTLVVRAGYGVYSDTSVYRDTALSLAQQAPLSKSLSVQRSADCPITLAHGFINCAGTTAQTFAVDPNFRVGYAQTWQLLIQRDLPGSLQATITYLGVKGTRGVQEFLPNTYPIGAANPCPACPSGFIYRTSNGNSTRQSAQVQLRRRLRAGLTASVQYTFSKSIDDDAILGGQGPVSPGATTQSSGSATIAQDWRNLRAERGPSSFDQRHLLNAQIQYTSGQGLGGGALMGGWRGRALKEWTIATQITAGSGLPETPIYFATAPGSGFTETIRPNYTGANRYSGSAPGQHFNPAAFTAPAPGSWGSAGRNSLIGPGQFTLNSSLSRTFRVSGRLNLDTRLDTSNLLNRAVFTSWDNIINNAEYGLPLAVNPMRTMQITARLRF